MRCDHPECNGKHGGAYRWADRCEGYRERERERHREREKERRAAGLHELPGDNEVAIVPGRCVSWECYDATDGDSIACAVHRQEFETGLRDARKSVLTEEDYALKATMTRDEWTKYRKNIYRQRVREQDPNYVPLDVVGHAKRAGAASALKSKAMMDKRREAILAELDAKGFVRNVDLRDTFGVQEDMVRRLIKSMDAEGLLTRGHGGAVRLGDNPRNYVLRSPAAA